MRKSRLQQGRIRAFSVSGISRGLKVKIKPNAEGKRIPIDVRGNIKSVDIQIIIDEPVHPSHIDGDLWIEVMLKAHAEIKARA